MIQSLKLAIETSTERVFEVTASHEDSVVRLQLIIGLIRFWSFAKMNAQSIFLLSPKMKVILVRYVPNDVAEMC